MVRINIWLWDWLWVDDWLHLLFSFFPLEVDLLFEQRDWNFLVGIDEPVLAVSFDAGGGVDHCSDKQIFLFAIRFEQFVNLNRFWVTSKEKNISGCSPLTD